MGDQIIITDENEAPKPDIVVVQPVREPVKDEKTTITETVKVTKTETH